MLSLYLSFPFDQYPELDDRIEWAAFLGQVKQESGNLCYVQEWRCT